MSSAPNTTSYPPTRQTVATSETNASKLCSGAVIGCQAWTALEARARALGTGLANPTR